MPTTVISKIGHTNTPTAMDYTSLQAWHDAAPADLTTADQVWVGECYDQGTFTASSGYTLFIGGHTTDPTRYFFLRCAAGAGFAGKSGVRTRALDYTAAGGVAVEGTGSINNVIRVTSDYTRFDGLQIYIHGFYGGAALFSAVTTFLGTNLIIRNGTGGYAAQLGTGSGLLGSSLVNCLVHCTNGGGVQYGNCYNCTLIGPNGYSALNPQYSGSQFVRNCAIFGFANLIASGTLHSASDYNATDLPMSFGAGTHNLNNLTFVDEFVQKSTDFRTEYDGDLHAGTPDSTNSPTDITGFARDATTPFIGAWEPGVPVPAMTVNPNSIPASHPVNITLTLSGFLTAWNNSTTIFTLSGVSGVTKVSQNVTSPTAATVVVTTGASIGALTITESVTGSTSAPVAITTPLGFSITAQVAVAPDKIVIAAGGSVTVAYTISGSGTTTAQLVRTDGASPVSLTCDGAPRTVTFTPVISQLYFIPVTDVNGTATARLEIIVQQTLTASDPTAGPNITSVRSGNWTDTNPATSPWPGGVLPGVNDIVGNTHTIKVNSRLDGSGNILQCARFVNQVGGVLNIWNDNSTAAALWVTDYAGQAGSALNIDSTYTPGKVAVLLLRNRPFHVNDTDANSPDGIGQYWNAFDLRGGDFSMRGTTVTPFVRAAAAIPQGATYIDLLYPVTGWAQSFLIVLPDTRGTRDVYDLSSQLEVCQILGVGKDANGNANQRVYLLRPTIWAHPQAVNVDGSPAIRPWDRDGNYNPEPLTPHVVCMSKTCGIITEDPTGIGGYGGQPRAHMLLNGGGRVDCRDSMVSHGMGRCTQAIVSPDSDNSPTYDGRYYRALPFLTLDLHGPSGGLGYDGTVDEPEFQPSNPANTFGLNGPSHRFINCLVLDPYELNDAPTSPPSGGPPTSLGIVPTAIGGWVHFFTHYGLYKGNVGFNFAGTCWGISDGSVQRNLFTKNLVMRTDGLGGRLDVGGLLIQGSGWLLGSYGNWFRNNVAADAAGFGIQRDQYSFGTINVPSTDGNYAPSDPRYYEAHLPNFEGASVFASGQSTGVDNSYTPILQWDNNEGYGSARHIVIYTLGTLGSLGGVITSSSDQTMSRETVWAVTHFACFPYGNYRLVKDTWFVRGDIGQGPTFDVNTDYTQSEITYLNWDVEGFSGIVATSAQCGIQNDPDQPDVGGPGRIMFRGGRYKVGCLVLAQLNGGSGLAGGFYGVHVIVGGDRTTGTNADAVTVLDPGGGSPTVFNMQFFDTSDIDYTADYNLVAPTTLQLNRWGGRNYDVYPWVASPSTVLPQSYDPHNNPPQLGSAQTWGAPEAGMTNQQCHDKYAPLIGHQFVETQALYQGTLKSGWPDPSTPGKCWGNKLPPPSAAPVTWISGRRGSASGTADDVGPSSGNGLFVALDDVTIAATGFIPASGSLAVTLDDVSVVAAGALKIKGAGSVTLDDVTCAATSSENMHGAGNITLDDVACAATMTGTTPIKTVYFTGQISWWSSP